MSFGAQERTSYFADYRCFVGGYSQSKTQKWSQKRSLFMRQNRGTICDLLPKARRVGRSAFGPLRTLADGAANDGKEPKSTDAATSSNGRDEHGADVLGCDHSPCRLLKRVKYTHAYAT